MRVPIVYNYLSLPTNTPLYAYDTVGNLQVVVCKLYGFRSVDPSYLTRLYIRAYIDY